MVCINGTRVKRQWHTVPTLLADSTEQRINEIGSDVQCKS